ncbi:MAG: hypothetical protein KDC61_09070 [Saprospiraceae bacterium]|nr:hypothetical protein [Saprospiraceae bacterium]MCB0544110.1 hypothetical protein [Saprospiraceae bacterium]MCB0574700.1 hypothetical protein [Saprospiraceae bacterium]MCB9356775.1 hypothetical protein [Lewinellaceae bacterium]
MKYLLFTLSAALILAACTPRYGVIEVIPDDYKNNKNIRLQYAFDAKERRSDLQTAYMTFLRVVSADGSEEAGVYVRMNKAVSAFEVKQEGFINADGRKLPVSLLDRRENVLSETNESTEDHSYQDSIGVIHTVTVVTGVSTDSWKQEHFYIPLTAEHIEAIRNCRSLEFRYYLGPEPATVVVAPGRLEKIRQWLAMR